MDAACQVNKGSRVYSRVRVVVVAVVEHLPKFGERRCVSIERSGRAGSCVRNVENERSVLTRYIMVRCNWQEIESSMVLEARGCRVVVGLALDEDPVCDCVCCCRLSLVRK